MAKRQTDKWSTNKRVKPQDKNTTSAKFEKPTTLSATSKANKKVAEALQGQRKSEEAQRAAVKRGYLTQNEALILQKRKKTRKPVI